MRRIPNIALSKDELIRIRDDAFDFGGESIICRSERPDTAYKIFTCGISPEKDEKKLQNKYNKLMAIYNIDDFCDSVIPISTLSFEGEFIGYEMSYDFDDISMFIAGLTEEEKMFYLKKTKDILKYYEKKDIVYGDIKSDNILINPKRKTAKFCDIDNIQIGNYKMDVMSDTLRDYYLMTGYLDSKTQAYMHNLLTMSQLSQNDYYKNILNKISIGIIPPCIPKSARKTVESMAEPNLFTGEYVIQYIKK